jgi:hypothetical protein
MQQISLEQPWATCGSSSFSVALLELLKYDYFIEKPTKSVEKVSTLALDMTI